MDKAEDVFDMSVNRSNYFHEFGAVRLRAEVSKSTISLTHCPSENYVVYCLALRFSIYVAL